MRASTGHPSSTGAGAAAVSRRPSWRRAARAAALLIAVVAAAPLRADAAALRAVSLNAVAREAARGSAPGTLGQPGLTHVRAFVFDEDRRDLILVGSTQDGVEPIALDELAVALRAALKHRAWPSVSIDRTAETAQTGRQQVNYGGRIEGTSFGQTLFEADVILKQIGLSLVDARVWGVRSYLDLLAERSPSSVDQVGRSRFWFSSEEPVLVARPGVGIIQDCQMRVDARRGLLDGSSEETAADPAGQQFSAALSASYDDLGLYFPAVRRLQQLFYLVGLSAGLERLNDSTPAIRESLRYWLEERRITAVATEDDYPLLTASRQLEQGGNRFELEVDGGVELRALVLDLHDGIPSAFRELVLGTRPGTAAAEWELPLTDDWIDALSGRASVPLGSGVAAIKSIPGLSTTLTHSYQPLGAIDPDPRRLGLPDRRRDILGDPTRRDPPFGGGGPGPGGGGSALAAPSPLQDGAGRGAIGSGPLMPRTPEVQTISSFLGRHVSHDIGGVMLSGAAAAPAGASVGVDLSSGGFSLLVDGAEARLAPDAYRRFVTALWAVYYSPRDPGISIDPISPDLDKHFVRYIGNVVNSDLGRVMRDADYVMKKWAVGTERPTIPGFLSPDDISGRRGSLHLAASRFWFVPEGMTFRRSADMLLFDAGRMTVRTEYLTDEQQRGADPSNEAFAAWFTSHYDTIANRYPVYDELFEYARLVALAKYLKASGVPLHWFLMANKGLVLTEDSPGTVDALAKGSEYFKNVRISGGVELTSEGRYILDDAAAKALQAARAQQPSRASAPSAPPPSVAAAGRPVSFQVSGGAYTVLPQHSLTGGRDARGNRYQTDLALRREGEPGLEIVRYYDPARPEGGEFGDGWRLLLPYRAFAEGAERREVGGLSVPATMRIRHLLSGEDELLAFDTERYTVAGWLPAEGTGSQFVGLFPTVSGTFRLVDRIGNEFRFDEQGYLTEQLLGDEHRVRIEYLDAELTDAFDGDPYEVRSSGEATTQFRGVRIPSSMSVHDFKQGSQELLEFREDERIVGYYPRDASTSRFRVLALLTDLSHRLLDAHGNEIAFRPDGSFAGFSVSDRERMVRAITQGEELRLEYAYRVDPTGRLAVAKLSLFEGTDPYPQRTLRYGYDDLGRLAAVTRAERAADRKGSL